MPAALLDHNQAVGGRARDAQDLDVRWRRPMPGTATRLCSSGRSGSTRRSRPRSAAFPPPRNAGRSRRKSQESARCCCEPGADRRMQPFLQPVLETVLRLWIWKTRPLNGRCIQLAAAFVGSIPIRRRAIWTRSGAGYEFRSARMSCPDQGTPVLLTRLCPEGWPAWESRSCTHAMLVSTSAVTARRYFVTIARWLRDRHRRRRRPRFASPQPRDGSPRGAKRRWGSTSRDDCLDE